MGPANKTPGAGGRPGAAHFVTTVDRHSVPHPVADAQASKWLAVTLYCIGAQSLGETQSAFSRHPEWRAA